VDNLKIARGYVRWTVVRFRATIKRALENQKSSFSTIHNAAFSCLIKSIDSRWKVLNLSSSLVI
jgi:hypothetical protein